MGANRPAAAPANTCGTSRKTRPPTDRGRGLLPAAHRLRLAILTRRFPALADGVLDFYRWHSNGTVDRVHNALRDRVRDRSGRDPITWRRHRRGPVGQRLKTPWANPRGYDAGKRVNARKRHIVTDTLGGLVIVMSLRLACKTATVAS
jgi:hypothetical protein